MNFDVKLMFTNCCTYNPRSDLEQYAKKLSKNWVGRRSALEKSMEAAAAGAEAAAAAEAAAVASAAAAAATAHAVAGGTGEEPPAKRAKVDVAPAAAGTAAGAGAGKPRALSPDRRHIRSARLDIRRLPVARHTNPPLNPPPPQQRRRAAGSACFDRDSPAHRRH